MNIYDVSKKAGVSIATVSRVLNGNPNVTDKTKNKVLSVMEELGYTPNVFARGLGLNTMHTIGIMCSDSSDIFLANAVYYLEQSLRRNGYEAFLCCTGHELKSKQHDLQLLLSKHVDAVIMVGSQYIEADDEDNAYIIKAAEKVPIMLINGWLKHPNIYCTLCDDVQAIRDEVERLASHGRKNFLFLYRSDSFSSKSKLKGFKGAISELSLPFTEESVFLCSENIPVTRDLLLSHFGQSFPFDAIIAAEDCLAVGAIKYAKEIRKQIPEELEIIGYNNSLLCLCTEPELSTIDNHVEALSVTTVNTLMRILQGASVSNKISLSNEFIARKTSC